MGQAFVKGIRVPVTKVVAGPCVVTQIVREDKNGYWAVQLGFGEKKAPRFLREVRLSEEPKFKVGDEIVVSEIFSEGDTISVTGTSKGKGFAGVIKRWGFAMGPRTHGQSDRLRAPGSIGQGTTPGRVWKGKKMAGRMGGETVMVKNLKIISIDPKNNELTISGPVPGTAKGLLVIKKLRGEKKNEQS